MSGATLLFSGPIALQVYGRCERVLRFMSWVAKLKGDKNSECKLSNGRSRSYKVLNCLFQGKQGNEWSRSYKEINQHPNRKGPLGIFHGILLPMDFWTPQRFLSIAKPITSMIFRHRKALRDTP